jgi:DNA replication and repair protein RecF
MRVTRLDIAGLRRFRQARLDPGPGLNLLIGDNGAGKTSVLEALHLMAYGRSFRGRVRDGLVGASAESVEVFVEWETPGPDGHTRRRRAGLRHSGQSWEGRLDGAPVDSLGELCSALAVVTFEPGSHVLVSGSGEPRRRQLDWGLFHVEPGFLPLWRRYGRALRQRNALLKARSWDGQLESWEHELAQAGEPPQVRSPRARPEAVPTIPAGSRCCAAWTRCASARACTSATCTTAPACTTWCSRSSTTRSTRPWPGTPTTSW